MNLSGWWHQSEEQSGRTALFLCCAFLVSAATSFGFMQGGWSPLAVRASYQSILPSDGVVMRVSSAETLAAGTSYAADVFFDLTALGAPLAVGDRLVFDVPSMLDVSESQYVWRSQTFGAPGELSCDAEGQHMTCELVSGKLLAQAGSFGLDGLVAREAGSVQGGMLQGVQVERGGRATRTGLGEQGMVQLVEENVELGTSTDELPPPTERRATPPAQDRAGLWPGTVVQLEGYNTRYVIGDGKAYPLEETVTVPEGTSIQVIDTATLKQYKIVQQLDAAPDADVLDVLERAVLEDE